jgi:hypothetical protein
MLKELSTVSGVPALKDHSTSTLIPAQSARRHPNFTTTSDVWVKYAEMDDLTGSQAQEDIRPRFQDGVTDINTERSHTQPGTTRVTDLVGTIPPQGDTVQSRSLDLHSMTPVEMPSEVTKTASQSRSTPFLNTPYRRALLYHDIATSRPAGATMEADIDWAVRWGSAETPREEQPTPCDITDGNMACVQSGEPIRA